MSRPDCEYLYCHYLSLLDYNKRSLTLPIVSRGIHDFKGAGIPSVRIA
jgi:hypothetical protein